MTNVQSLQGSVEAFNKLLKRLQPQDSEFSAAQDLVNQVGPGSVAELLSATGATPLDSQLKQATELRAQGLHDKANDAFTAYAQGNMHTLLRMTARLLQQREQLDIAKLQVSHDKLWS